MNKIILISAVLMVSFSQLIGQNRFSISGILIDNESKEPLTGAHINLLNLADSSSLDGITEENGSFLFEKLKMHCLCELVI